jgi:hypothetical protein
MRWRGARRPWTGTKYGNVPTRIDGILFHSKLEASRYQELKAMEAAGLIRGLELQPKFPLVVNGVDCGNYLGDFRYVDCETGDTVTEDTKGVATDVYKLKKRLVAAIHGVDVQEVRKVRGRR